MESSPRLLCDSHICRLCAQENKYGACLFPHEESETDLSQLVNKYLPLKVERDGKFPIVICPGCNIQLEATKQFLDLILGGQRKLRELFQLQQETLQRQEKERHALETALKSANPSTSVATYTIESDESGEKFIIQILSDGPLFPPEHELSILLHDTEKPKRKRGRPQKSTIVPTDKPSNILTEEAIVKSDHENDEPDINTDETRRKRKIKVPSRYQEAVQGKELDRIFKEEGVIDDESDTETLNENQQSPNLEDQIIGRLQNKEGEELGELVIVSKHPNKLRTKYKEKLGKYKRRYECEICGNGFLHYARYQVHKATHNNIKYRCAEVSCHLQTDTKSVIDEHQKETDHAGVDFVEETKNQEEKESPVVTIKTDDDNNEDLEDAGENIEKVIKDPTSQHQFTCDVCAKMFTCKQNYEIHCKAIHENHRPFQCSKCDKSFAYVNSLKCHMLQHKDKNEKLYTCEICKKAFNHPSSLVYHREAEHNNGRRFVCNKCNKSFKHKQLLHRHQLVHSDERPHNCKLCTASFKTRANLLNHMPIHTGEKKYYCLQCGQAFAHRTSLTLHLRWHNGQKPYECEICMKTFSQKGNLAEHKRIHTGEKPYCCEVCGRKFTTSSQCKLHMMRHTGERPWRCEYCAKTFLHKDTWKCHTRRHRNERPYQCQQCFRGFTEQWALKKHERLHTGEKPYVCDVCQKSFADCSNLTKHKKIHELNSKNRSTKPKNIKVISTDEGKDQQVLFLTYQDSNSNDSQMQTLVHLVDDNVTPDDSSLVEENFLSSISQLQHFINESGESVSLTTEDGQPIKVLSMEQQENLKRLIPNGILLPIANTSQDNGNMLELKDEEPSSVGHVLKSDIQFLNEDYDKLNDDIQFLTEDGGICFVTSYNADESMSAQYL